MKPVIYMAFLLFLAVAHAQNPRLMVPSKHPGEIVDAAISPDDNFVATISSENTIVLWELRSGRQLYALNYDEEDRGKEGNDNKVIFSPDGNYFLVYSAGEGFSSDGSRPVIYKVMDGQIVAKLGFNTTRAAFSPDAAYIATGGADGTVNLYQTTTGALARTLDSYAVDMSEFAVVTNEMKNMPTVVNGKPVDTAKVRKQLNKFMAESASALHANAFNPHFIDNLYFSAGGKEITVSYRDKSGKIFYLKSGKMKPLDNDTVSVNDHAISGITGIRSKDNNYEVSSSNGPVTVYKVPNMEVVTNLEEFEEDWDINQIKIGAAELFREDRATTEQTQTNSDGTEQGLSALIDLSSPDKKYKLEIDTDANKGINIPVEMMTPWAMKIIRTDTRKAVIKFKFSVLSDKVLFDPANKFVVISSIADQKLNIIELGTGKSKEIDRVMLPFNISPSGHDIFASKNSFFSPDGRYLLVTAFGASIPRGYVPVYGLPQINTGQDFSKLPGLPLIMIDLETGTIKEGLGNAGQMGLDPIFSPPCTSDPKGGKYLVTRIANVGNTAELYNTTTGQLIGKLAGHNKPIKNVYFSINDDYLLTDAEENILKLWNTSNGKLLCNYIPAGNSAYMQILPDGYYYGPRDAIKNVYYVTKDLKVITFDQLDIKYNRPDKVLEAEGSKDNILINAYKSFYRLRIKRLNVDTTMFDDQLNIPDLEIVDHDKFESTQTNSQLKIHIRAKDTISNLDRLNIWVNRVPVAGAEGFALHGYRRKSLDTTVAITLSTGRNNVEAFVLNANSVESYHEQLTINYNPINPEPERLYFVGLGIDHFADATENMTTCINDIRALASALKAHYGANITIDTLFDKDITEKNISLIKQSLSKLTVNDKVILAYSGHGFQDNGKNYLSTYQVNFNKPEEWGLPYGYLENILTNIKPRRKLMLIDACQSGESDGSYSGNAQQVKALNSALGHKGKLKDNLDLMHDLFVNVEKGDGTTIIASAPANGLTAFNKALGHGVFTYHILEALTDNDHRRLSFINSKKSTSYQNWTVNALMDYLSETVPEGSQYYPQPVMRSENFEADWDIWK